MTIDFAKAQASGNDFIILDNRDNKLGKDITDFSELAKEICTRKFSVGADGVLVLERSKAGDFKMRIFNPDGREVTMCGNGIRCSAVFASKNGWCASPMKIETAAGVLEVTVSKGTVRIKMTEPRRIMLDQHIGVGKSVMSMHTIDTGVPHAINFVDDLDNYPVKEMGGKIRYHKVFEPAGTNVDFVETRGASSISVRTYERGVEDETLACGTGAVASAIIANLIRGIKEPVEVLTRSGETVRVFFRNEHNRISEVYLEGKAHIVYKGGMTYA